MSFSIFLRIIGKYTNVENFQHFSTQHLKNLVEKFSKKQPEQYNQFIRKNPNLISTILNIQEKKDVEKYIQLLETSNSEVELFYLSKLYEEGIFITKDEQKAKEFLEKAKKINEATITDLSKDEKTKKNVQKNQKLKEIINVPFYLSSLTAYYIIFNQHQDYIDDNWKEKLQNHFTKDDLSLIDSSILNIILKVKIEESIQNILKSKSASGLFFLSKLYEYGEFFSKE